MTTMTRLTMSALVLLCSSTSLRADDERLRTSAVVVREMFGGAEETSIPGAFLAKAKCVAVVPGVRKAAIGFGGQYGRGYIVCRNDSATGWTAPGGIRVEGGSVGLQIGGSETDVVLLVLNERGADRLLSSRFTVGADAAIAAGPVGRQASAQTDATLTAEILAWSRSRGAFAGISLQGSTLREDSSENKELYGSEISNKDVIAGKVTAPAAASGLIDALRNVR